MQAESNINEDKSSIQISEKDLEKVPEETLAQLQKADGKSGFRTVPLKKTGFAHVVKFIENEDTRKKIDFAVNTINTDKNVPIIEKLTQLRQELALLMGYQSFSEMVLKDKMAKNPQNVEKLLDDLSSRIKTKGRKEREKLDKFKQELTGKSDAKIQPWDISFYGSRYKKKLFNIEEDIIQEYFPADHVKQATMDIYQELLGLDFKKLDKAETWHKEVSCYEVKDKKSKQLLGHFYLDLYPRDDKFSHAAAMTLIKRAKVDG